MPLFRDMAKDYSKYYTRHEPTGRSGRDESKEQWDHSEGESETKSMTGPPSSTARTC